MIVDTELHESLVAYADALRRLVEAELADQRRLPERLRRQTIDHHPVHHISHPEWWREFAKQ